MAGLCIFLVGSCFSGIFLVFSGLFLVFSFVGAVLCFSSFFSGNLGLPGLASGVPSVVG